MWELCDKGFELNKEQLSLKFTAVICEKNYLKFKLGKQKNKINITLINEQINK